MRGGILIRKRIIYVFIFVFLLNCAQFNRVQSNQLNEIVEHTDDEINESQQVQQNNILENELIKEETKDDETQDEKQSLQVKTTLLKASQMEPFTTKKGFFYIHIYGNGKETKRKVEITLNSTDRSKSQTISFKEAGVSGYSDNHNFQILTTTAKTKATEQNSYSVFSFKFSYTKPAHYKAGHSYSEKTDDYRFNFNKSPTDTTTTVNNTGHNAVDTTETLQMQINLTNCGITFAGEKKSNATGHINLSKGYYSGLTIDPNGGIHDGKNSKNIYGIKCCLTEATINNPTRKGYAFIGWTFIKGNNCGSVTFDKNTSKFKYCGKSTSNSNVGNDDTCTLKAEWIKNNESLVLPETGLIDYSLCIMAIGVIMILISRKEKV